MFLSYLFSYMVEIWLSELSLETGFRNFGTNIDIF